MQMQHGGLKLINPEKYTDEDGEVKIGFQPIIDMINSEGSRLQILSYSSLSGFIFSLVVNPLYTEYYGLDDTFSQFDKPITSFVLKIVIITPPSSRRELDYYRIYIDHNTKPHIYNKFAETKDTFFQECKLQQHIWIKSIEGGREPICPSVANLVFFTNSEAKEILHSFKLKIGENNNSKKRNKSKGKRSKRRKPNDNPRYNSSERSTDYSSEVPIEYLLNALNASTYELGIMTMPTIENSCTLNDFKNMYNPDPRIENTVTKESVYEAYVYAIAQLIRLFIEMHVIHFDLHDNNVLVYYHRNILKCMLIDFGEACDLKKKNKYMNNLAIRNFYLHKANLYVRFIDFNRKKEIANEEKNEFIEEIIKLLIHADTQISFDRKGKDKSKGKVFQMEWIKTIPNDMYHYVFDTLTQLISGPSRLSKEIIHIEEPNAIISFNKQDGSEKIPDDFYASRISSDDVIHDDCSEIDNRLCVISGGKHKKSRKNKRNKNYNPKNKSRKFSNKNYLQ